MKVVDCFQFRWIAKKVVVNESLCGRVEEEVFVARDKAVVDVSVVSKMAGCALEKVVVELVPGVFDKGHGNIAEGRRELGANPSPSDLFVGALVSTVKVCVMFWRAIVESQSELRR